MVLAEHLPTSSPTTGSSAAPPSVPAPATPPASAEGLLGVILARAAVDVVAPAEGRIQALDVRLGDRVPSGGRIARIDLPTARFDLEVADASAQAAKIEHEKAQLELANAEERQTRKTALAAASLATGEELATAHYQAKLAHVQVEMASARMREQHARVGNLQHENAEAEIRAPFEGIVAMRYADPGARLRKGDAIVRLIAARSRFVRFAVPEEQAAQVSVGLVVRVIAGHLELTGRVEKIAPEIDAASLMVFVEAGIEEGAEPLGAVISGEMVRVWLSARGRE